MLPMITSSTARGSSSTRAIASERVMRQSSSAGTSLSAPHDLQKGVLTPSTTTTSRRGLTEGPPSRERSFLDLIPGDAVLLELLVQIAPGRVDRASGPGNVPAVLLELPQDEDPLRLVLVLLQRAEGRRIGNVKSAGGAAGGRLRPGRRRARGRDRSAGRLEGGVLRPRSGRGGPALHARLRPERLARQGIDVARLDRVPLDHDQEPLHRVAQLAHIAAPRACGQALDGTRSELLRPVTAGAG